MIKLFRSGMVGAPNILNNTAGTLITVLDACLVNGWGSATVDSVVIDSGIATVTKSGHPFEADTVSLIAEATVSGGSINGEQKVLTATATTYTFDATGISNQTATGTITHVLPSLGFEKVYSGTNLAAYRSPNIDSTRHYLRVTDTGTTVARVIAYETMSDINTGTKQYPTDTQLSGGTFWYKSSDASAQAWLIMGDDKGFYFRPQPYSTSSSNQLTSVCTCYFGDFTSTKAIDPFASALFAPSSTISGSPTNTIHDLAYIIPSGTNTGWISRSYTGIGGSINVIRSFNSLTHNASTTTRYSGDSVGAVTFPNPANGSMYVVPMHLGEVGGIYRGDLPGFYACPQNIFSTFIHTSFMSRLTGVIGLPDRRIMVVPSGAGVYFIDLTGPWR